MRASLHIERSHEHRDSAAELLPSIHEKTRIASFRQWVDAMSMTRCVELPLSRANTTCHLGVIRLPSNWLVAQR